MNPTLFFPLPIFLCLVWLLILPLIRIIESKINYWQIKGSISIFWSILITGSIVYELIDIKANGAREISPDFQNLDIFHVLSFKLTQQNLMIALIVSFLFFAIMLFSWKYLRWETLLDDYGSYKLYYYFLFFSCLTGFFVVLFANDAFLIFVGWEMMVIPGYGLVSIRPTKRSAEAGIKYAIISSIGSIFILYAVALIYQITGTLNLDEARTRILAINGIETDVSVWLAISFIIIGFGVTAGFAGFQTWIPDAYGEAASPVGAFISGTFTIASLIAYYKLLVYLFPVSIFDYAWLFIVGGLITMSLGNSNAFFQKDYRRILGYSSVSQRGYLLFGIGLVLTQVGGLSVTESIPSIELGFKIIWMFAISFAILEGLLFLIIGKILFMGIIDNSKHESRVKGALMNYPYLSTILILTCIGLAGLPPTIGFASKLSLIILAGMTSIPIIFILIFLINSALSLVYYSRIIQNLVFTKPYKREEIGKIPSSMNISITLVFIVGLIIGLQPNLILVYL
jgi:multicomponent Na+:H+ antiporter subunit D